MSPATWSLGCDPLGWPTAVRPDGTAWQLWPLTWWQLERHVAAPGGIGNDGYQTILDRSHIRRPTITAANIATIAARGLGFAQATAFARWLGPAWRLPTDAEWRQLYEDTRTASPRELIGSLAAQQGAPGIPGSPALLARLREGLPPGATLAQVMALGEHALELVTREYGYGARGSTVKGSGILSYPHDPSGPIVPTPAGETYLIGFCSVRFVCTRD